jgi:FHA domain-containing protein/zinc ribbon protein
MSTLTTTMEMEKCPACGADVRSQDKFCWNCGRSLRTASPSPQPEQTPSWSSARLVVTTSAGEVLQEYLLDKAAVTIGRVAPADIVLFKDKLVSRRHASVRYEQGHYVLRDERSANGTSVNGEHLEELVPYLLQDGDQVEIGAHRLVFRAQ